MSDRMMGYCGLICTDCEAFTATQAEDMVTLSRMAKEASEQLGVEMTMADAMCDGCQAKTGRQIGYCHECAIRLCAVQKHIENCAHCDDYACEKIEGFSKPGSPQRATLDNIRSSLNS
ncbi:DUF3795 domain-containing protein [Candidatus Bipolaricaulota bacterium]